MQRLLLALFLLFLLSAPAFAITMDVLSEEHGLIDNEVIFRVKNPDSFSVIRTFDLNLFTQDGVQNALWEIEQKTTDTVQVQKNVSTPCKAVKDLNGVSYCTDKDYFFECPDAECAYNTIGYEDKQVDIYSWIELPTDLDRKDGSKVIKTYNKTLDPFADIKLKASWKNDLSSNWGSGGKWKINPENWWNADWDYRQDLNVVDNNSSGDAVAGVVSRLTLDTASLISAGKMQSDCDDIRIIYLNTTDINVSHEGCNTADTNIYFMTQASISGYNDTNYDVYYGYSSATATNGVNLPSFDLDFGDASAPDGWTEGGTATWAFNNNYAETTTNNNQGWYYTSHTVFRAIEICFEADVKRASSANVTIGWNGSTNEDSGGYQGHTPDDLGGYALVGGTGGAAGLYVKSDGAPSQIVTFDDMSAGTSYNMKACRSRNGVWEAWQDGTSKGTSSNSTHNTFRQPRFFLDQGTAANWIDDFIMTCNHYCWGDVFPSATASNEETDIVTYTPDVNVTAPSGQTYDNRTTSTVTVTFNVSDADTNTLLVDFNYSTSQTEGTGTAVLVDENTTGANITCDDSDFSDTTNCEYSWNIDAVADGNYYILIRVDDADSQSDFNASAEDNNLWTSVAVAGDDQTGYNRRYLAPDSEQRDDNVFYSEAQANRLTDEEQLTAEAQKQTLILFGVLFILIIGVFIWYSRN